MKGFLTIVSLLISGVALEAPAPYAPSGWRPAGPSFELPERAPLDPRSKTPEKQEYLPPNQEYGPPEVDVSVRGLPTQEQLPIFQLSPVNGQQFVGSTFNTDLKNLEQNQRESQLQAQQAIYREFARQRQLEAIANAQRQANQQQPRQFVSRTSTNTTPKPDDFKTTTETTTERLNQGEVADNKDKVSVEVSKQNIQEYPPELFLDPLVQLSLQQQVSPVQLGQLRAPIFLEPVQKNSAQYAALTALVAQQQQLLQLQQSQLVQQQPQAEPQVAQVQPQLFQAQPQFVQPQPQYAPAPQYQPVNQYEAVQPVQGPATVQSAQPAFLQPQANQLLPRPQDQQVDEENQQQPQVVYYQPTQYQTEQPINQYQQPLNSYQAAIQPQLLIQDPTYQQQLAQQQFYQQQLAQQQLAQQQLAQQQLAQQQLAQQQQAQQGQGSLQSGLEAYQPGNGIEQDKDDNNDDDDGTTVTAVATAFGTRTQPRVYLTYGAPAPVPRVQANPGYQTTTEAQDESTTDGPAVAEATAVARGEGRRPARLRNRPSRVRPIFTLDKSGHLILAQEQ